MKNITIDNYLDSHYIHRSNWLRAAVLGANDGIISISSLLSGLRLQVQLEKILFWELWQDWWRELYQWQPVNTFL